MRISKRASTVLISLLFAVGALPALADTPSVDSFTLSPSSTGNNLPVAATWSMTNATGANINFACPDGVTIKNISGGSISCNSHTDVGSASPGSLSFYVTNVSGTTKTFAVTLYPKDSNGSEYAAGAVSSYLSVATSYQPITDFTASATSTPSSGAMTLSWSGVDITYSNMQFDCPSEIKLSSGGTNIPCNTIAFSSPLSTSGSVSVTAINSSPDQKTVTAHIYPGSGGSTYDATHGRSVSFVVLGKAAPTTPSVTAFAGPTGNASSGATLIFAWSVANAAGANLQFSCNNNLSFATATSSPLPCDTLAFSSPLPTTGTTTIVVTNKSIYGQSFFATLLPQDSSGTYLGTASESLLVHVLGLGQAAPATNSSASVSAPQSSPVAKAATLHAALVLSLTRGSRGSQVTILQTFLALNSSIYPEGLVTGYFGPATGAAVGRLQAKYNVAKPGDAGYGYVGPKTRALINSLTTP